MLTYVTANKDKIFLAKKGLTPLKISFETKALELTEIQSSSIEGISRHKAKQAFEVLKTPLFVTDDGWSIPALNGFPGPYMKYVNEWFSPQDYLHLMNNHLDKRIFRTVVLCYIDSKTIKTFSTSHEGRFISEVRGNGFAVLRVISMTNDGKSVAEYLEEGIKPLDDSAFWNEFGEWYKAI